MPTAAIPGGLNQFQEILIGTWSNMPLPNASNGEGGTDNPLSYNVMPLPQNPPNYILKNFTYYETVRFESNNDVALPATAPNRGSDKLQVPTALFYDQQVYFADGPGTGSIVHVENGAWLNIRTGDKLVGPYGPGIVLQDPNQQPSTITIAKQMSVPHGNSILALGSFTEPKAGPLSIPDAPSVLPTPAGLDISSYDQILNKDSDYQNPFPDLTANTNKPLQTAVKLINPTHYIEWHVSTANQGHAINIPFEQRAANVTAYAASYWLLSADGGGSYPYLAYTQNITMMFIIKGEHYTFPHVTSNVVTRN